MKTLLLSLIFLSNAPLAFAQQSSANENLTVEQMIEKVSGEYQLLPRDQNYDNICSLDPSDVYKFSGELPFFIENYSPEKAQLGPHMIFLRKYKGTDESFIKDYGHWLPVFDRPYFSALNNSALTDQVPQVSIENKNLISQTNENSIVLTQELTLSGQGGASLALQMVTFSFSAESVTTTNADGTKTYSSQPVTYAKYQYMIVTYGPRGLIEEIMYLDECVLKK